VGFHGKLVDQGLLYASFLEEHDDGLVVDERDNVPFVAKTLDEFLN
jgi:hypothetical protein